MIGGSSGHRAGNEGGKGTASTCFEVLALGDTADLEWDEQPFVAAHREAHKQGLQANVLCHLNPYPRPLCCAAQLTGLRGLKPLCRAAQLTEHGAGGNMSSAGSAGTKWLKPWVRWRRP
eukprot:1155283-Pelagomonas_calceolata.AAC.5